MDILEKAKKYAEGKALEAITSALEEAYANGYKAGWEDSEMSARNIVCDGVEYVDLHLPSGTLWSAKYLSDKSGCPIHLSYNEAVKLSIPNKEQYEELLKYTQRIAHNTKNTSGTDYLGREGKILFLPNSTFFMASNFNSANSPLFWLKDSEYIDDDRLCANGYAFDKKYMGYKLCVLLVK